MPIKKKATKKAATKKVPAKKVVAKKTAAKKAPTKKTAAKKAPAKKAPKKIAQKPASKKAPAKKIKLTRIIARVDVGFGNQLYIRGENGGLDWERGIQMENVSAYEWRFTTHYPAKSIEFKFLINDGLWYGGGNLTVIAGKELISSPTFSW